MLKIWALFQPACGDGRSGDSVSCVQFDKIYRRKQVQLSTDTSSPFEGLLDQLVDCEPRGKNFGVPLDFCCLGGLGSMIVFSAVVVNFHV